MITLAFTEKEVRNTHTYELVCNAEGGNPFVKDADDIFLNIASPSDMILHPDTPDGTRIYRDSTVTLIFRDRSTMDFTRDNMQEQIDALNKIILEEKTNELLFSNIT